MDGAQVPLTDAQLAALPNGTPLTWVIRGNGGICVADVIYRYPYDKPYLPRGAKGYRADITRIRQQTRFRMNEKGARSESAVAIGIARCLAMAPAQPFVFDEPFLAWIEHPVLNIPFFAAWIAPDVWADPGDIEKPF